MRQHGFNSRRPYWLIIVSFVCWPAFHCHGNLWGISHFYGRVIQFDHADGSELSSIELGSESGPTGVATRDGTIFVSSFATGRILFYDSATGQPLSLPGGDPGVFADFNSPADPEGAAAPAQLRFGPDGNLYASEFFGEKVRAYDPVTGARLPNAAFGLVGGAGGLAFEPDGTLLVGSAASPDPPMPAMISRFQNGQLQAPFFVAMQGEMFYPASLLFLPNGDLLAVDVFLDQILRFNSGGDYLGVFATMPVILEGRPSSPSDIVFDPDGNLIVALLGPTYPGEPEGDQGQLLRYDLNGNLLETIESGLEQIGGLAWTASPLTLAGNYDGAGGVDEADYARWRDHFGNWVAPGNGADGSGDGTIDAADYVLWRKAAGAPPAAGAQAAVPEPLAATLWLLGIGPILLATRRGRGRTTV